MPYISRYKILSSFLWNRFAASIEINKGPKRSCLLSTPVNLRKMVDPPLLDDSFGNAAGGAISVVSSEDDIEEEGYNYRIVNKLTEAMSKFNKEFVKKLHDGKLDRHFILDGADENTLKREVVGFACSSLLRFPIYEADFRWGKPIWCAVGGVPKKNLHVFLDTKNGDGIEAWINMRAEDMAKFESDKELLAYASPTSCP
ncbi:hypothetical protein Ddye_025779 [Dipteronia dyeriana]|uniref:Uncharacterized protein n=1 Tax=Dipteronia dyeriana TaxID=168575 RepID=A0AAD9TLU4_9ROSI|nr:hypothetical protein Ddye_025779 [Dipteronia dyeriana]